MHDSFPGGTVHQYSTGTAKIEKPTRLFICKDIRLFMNTIDKAVKTMTEAGLAVQSAREDQGEFIELTIRIPKEPGQRPTAKPA